MKKIKVLIIDDSALVRQMLTEILQSDPEIIVVDTAIDPLVARQKIKLHNPDVLTLDIEMPRMDGLQFLEKLMALRPMPVVMLSSLTQKGAEIALRALDMGAVDYVAKPTKQLSEQFVGLREEIIAKVKAAASAKVGQYFLQGGVPVPKPSQGRHYSSTEKLIAIGASTGGVEAVGTVLRQMPADCPAIVITQHMPAQFTASFANRLNGSCQLTVAEAEDGMRLLPGHAYIAPGGFQLEIVRSGANFVCRVGSSERVSGHSPSVDVLFHSVARSAGPNAVGVILTGMGRDGAEGLLAMRQANAHTLGQDSAAMVYGMPKAAFELGAVEEQVPLLAMAARVLALSAGDRAVVRAVRV